MPQIYHHFINIYIKELELNYTTTVINLRTINVMNTTQLLIALSDGEVCDPH